MSDEVRATIYVHVPMEATMEETDRLMDEVAKLVYDFERGQWDAIVTAHIRDRS